MSGRLCDRVPRPVRQAPRHQADLAFDEVDRRVEVLQPAGDAEDGIAQGTVGDEPDGGRPTDEFMGVGEFQLDGDVSNRQRR